MLIVPLTLFYCSSYEFKYTLSTQEHAGVQVIISGNIYISQLNITKYIHMPVGMDQTEALMVYHLHLFVTHSEC